MSPRAAIAATFFLNGAIFSALYANARNLPVRVHRGSAFRALGCSAVPAPCGGRRLGPMEPECGNGERSHCVGSICGSRPTPARRGLRASNSVGRGGRPRRGHLRDAGVSGLPTSRPRIPSLPHRRRRVPASSPVPACGSLRRLRPGTRVLGSAAATVSRREWRSKAEAPGVGLNFTRFSRALGIPVRSAQISSTLEPRMEPPVRLR
jgi:hypothetical protein